MENLQGMLMPLKQSGKIEWQIVPSYAKHNAHIFYIKLKDINQRQVVIDKPKSESIYTVFHYIPLHRAKAGLFYGNFYGEDIYTTKESERLLRLPIWFGITSDQVIKVCSSLKSIL